MPIVQIQPRNARNLFRNTEENVNAQDERGFTCLHWLVMTGNDRRDVGTLRRLLERGANPMVRDTKSLTALDRACTLGRLNMMETLVEYSGGEALHAPTAIAGRTPLHFANESLQYQAAVPLLLKLGADINVRSKHRGRTILHETVLRHDGTPKTAAHVEWLVTHCGANVQAVDHHGWTALHYAAFMGHVDLVASLLRLGASPRTRDKLGRTPLHVTGRKVPLPPWDEDITLVLVEPRKKCQPDDENMNDKRKQFLELQQQHRPPIHPANANTYIQHTHSTNQPMHSSSAACASQIVQLLLQHGAEAWSVDRQGNLAFFWAAQANDLTVILDFVQAAALEGMFGKMPN